MTQSPSKPQLGQEHSTGCLRCGAALGVGLAFSIIIGAHPKRATQRQVVQQVAAKAIAAGEPSTPLLAAASETVGLRSARRRPCRGRCSAWSCVPTRRSFAQSQLNRECLREQ